MPNDAPLVVHVLEAVSGAAPSFPAVRASVARASGASEEVVGHLLYVMHREDFLQWTIGAGTAGESAATVRDTQERGEVVACALTSTGRAKLDAWREAERAGLFALEDLPVEQQAPFEPPPRRPSHRAIYPLWDAILVIRAADRAHADAAVRAFSGLIPHIWPVAIESRSPEAPTALTREGAAFEVGVELVIHYRFNRKMALRFDSTAIRLRGMSARSQCPRLDLAWSEIASAGIGEVDFALHGPFLLIRMADGTTWRFECWDEGMDDLLDFVKSFPGVDAEATWFGKRRDPWFWTRTGDISDLPARYARFWDVDAIRAGRKYESAPGAPSSPNERRNSERSGRAPGVGCSGRGTAIAAWSGYPSGSRRPW